MRFESSNVDETRAVAAKIAASCRPGAVYALRGDLGAGKTVFSGGFATALGITEPLCSPTFTIVQEYDINCERLPELRRLYHMDVYRIQDAGSALAFGIDDFLDDPAAVKLIEWPERVEELLPPGTVVVEIRHAGGDAREIVVSQCC